jgi:hypothetical protein
MITPYKKTLQRFAVYYAVAISLLIIFPLLEKIINRNNVLMSAMGPTIGIVFGGVGIWLTASLVVSTLRLEMESRLLKRLLFFVAYLLAFLPIVFVMGVYSLFFESGFEYLVLAYLLILPILIHLTYKEIHRNFCVYKFKKIFVNVSIDLAILKTKHISQMIVLHKIDPSYDVLSMPSDEIAKIVRGIDAEKRRKALKVLGTGFSLVFKVVGFGINILSSGPSNAQSINTTSRSNTPSSTSTSQLSVSSSSSIACNDNLSAADAGPSRPLFQANSVVGLSGAVVTWYQDGMMRYRHKCESCGELGLSEHYTEAPRQNRSLDTYKLCNKCGTNFRVIINAS